MTGPRFLVQVDQGSEDKRAICAPNLRKFSLFIDLKMKFGPRKSKQCHTSTRTRDSQPQTGRRCLEWTRPLTPRRPLGKRSVGNAKAMGLNTTKQPKSTTANSVGCAMGRAIAKLPAKHKSWPNNRALSSNCVDLPSTAHFLGHLHTAAWSRPKTTRKGIHPPHWWVAAKSWQRSVAAIGEFFNWLPGTN